VDTLKSLAVISLLGAVLYGAYVVASKPDKPLPKEVAEMAEAADEPLVEVGGSALSPPKIEGLDPKPVSGVEARSVPAPNRTTRVPRTIGEEPEVGPAAEVEKPLAKTADNGAVEQTSYEPKQESQNDYPTHYDEPTPAKPSSVNITSSRSSAELDPDIEAAKQRVQLYAFHMAWKTAREQVAQGRHREALVALTPFYRDPAIPSAEHDELVGWLDALAAKVIYSTQHLLEPPHEVTRGETLYTIGNKYRIPYMLLRNINGVRDNDVLIPGSKLKVLRGPFTAEASLSRKEITVFVQKMYAGRFPFTLGPEPAPPGEYLVKQKEPAKEFASANGTLGPKDPRNPYGGLYIDLGNGVSMHSSPGEAYGDQRFGCIQLAPRDAEDLMAILSKDESTVVIRD
jgi:lipoprotein-anchoring transpeptidase ErfK/SrfK